MVEKFKNKYRIESARLAGYDYSSNGYYFVTICAKNRKHYFGEVVNAEMKLSEIGQIARQCWLEIPKHFPFVVSDEHVVMPNHVHGIVAIDKPDPIPDAPHPVRPVETQNFASLRGGGGGGDGEPNWHPNKFGPQSKNLASIIRGFKIGVKKYATMNGIKFFWQARYHDHIIRNEESLERIKIYILDNPSNWNKDEFYC